MERILDRRPGGTSGWFSIHSERITKLKKKRAEARFFLMKDVVVINQRE